MHHNGKDDFSGRGDAATNEANAFCSNTFPLLSRSSMKRPFSLSSEREHQTPNIQDHFRCRGFRSRSKTIHADTFSRNASQYSELLTGNSCSEFDEQQKQHQNRSSTIKGLFDSSRSARVHGHSTSADRNDRSQSHRQVIPESILDEEMTVDDSEEEGLDGQFSMLLDPQHNMEMASHSKIESKGKPHITQQQQLKSIQYHLDSMKEKTAHHQQHRQNIQNPSVAPSHAQVSNSSFSSFMHEKSKFNHLGSSSPSQSTSTDSTVSSCPKLAIPHATQPNCEVEVLGCNNVSCSAKKSSGLTTSDTTGQPESLLANRSATADTTCLSPLAVPKPAASSSTLDCKAFCLTASSVHIPTEFEKEQFQRSLDSATTLVFHRRTGLPLTSSPVSHLALLVVPLTSLFPFSSLSLARKSFSERVVSQQTCSMCCSCSRANHRQIDKLLPTPHCKVVGAMLNWPLLQLAAIRFSNLLLVNYLLARLTYFSERERCIVLCV